jgi:hypothetical protein
MDYCSKLLTSESQDRAAKAEKDGTLDRLDDLVCECHARVGAVRKPWMDGPNGGPLRPKDHYESEPPKPYHSGKRGPSKSS